MAACGGSSSGSSADATNSVTLPELQTRFASFEAAIGTANIEDAEPTVFANLPASGSVNYTGVAAVGVVEDDGMSETNFSFLAVGSATVVADFDDQQITGTANNFFQVDDPNSEEFSGLTGTRIDGSLTYQFDQVSAGLNEYEGQITGSLTPTDQATVNVNMTGGAGFAGEDGDAFIAEAFSDTDDEVVAIFATKD